MQTKMLERQAATHDKQEKIERDKVKKALMKGNIEAGKIHAENAIRHHMESLNCRRMAARVDGVQARVANSAAQRQVILYYFVFINFKLFIYIDGRKS
jgi:charged multivesicular body protein 1